MQWKRARCALVLSCLSSGVPVDVVVSIDRMVAERRAAQRVASRKAVLMVLFPRGCIFRTGYSIEYQHCLTQTGVNTKCLRNSGVTWRPKLISSIAYVYTKEPEVRVGSMHYRIRNIPPSIQDY